MHRRRAMSDPVARIVRALERASKRPSSDYDLNPDFRLPDGRKLRAAGVLVPIHVEAGEATLYLTKRSSALKHHPGQIAFPGGKQEPYDVDATAAALREAHEEIGLDPANVELFGTLPPHETVTGFQVTPVVGRILAPFEPVPEAGEVEEVFRVPLDHVLKSARYAVQSRQWRGSRRAYYTVPYGPYYIWGATARILRTLADAAT